MRRHSKKSGKANGGTIRIVLALEGSRSLEAGTVVEEIGGMMPLHESSVLMLRLGANSSTSYDL